MNRNVFGWDYPPGVTQRMIDDAYGREEPCDVCGLMADGDCICPECPECGATGDPHCYEPDGHGLTRSFAQVALRLEAERQWEQEAREEAEAEAAYLRERDHYAKIADHIDGYDRDDLGESPDY
jgi:hypothetical protein